MDDDDDGSMVFEWVVGTVIRGKDTGWDRSDRVVERYRRVVGIKCRILSTIHKRKRKKKERAKKGYSLGKSIFLFQHGI
jgi:hypothetical protein